MWNAERGKDLASPLPELSTALAAMKGFASPRVMTMIAKLYPIDCVAAWIEVVPKQLNALANPPKELTMTAASCRISASPSARCCEMP